MNEYIEQVNEWRTEYARLSAEIRLEKATIRKGQSDGLKMGSKQCGLSRLKAIATGMIIDREYIKQLGIRLWNEAHADTLPK